MLVEVGRYKVCAFQRSPTLKGDASDRERPRLLLAVLGALGGLTVSNLLAVLVRVCAIAFRMCVVPVYFPSTG